MRPKRINIIARTELKKIWNDKPQLLVLLLGPIIVCTLMGYAAYKNPGAIDIGVSVGDLSNLQADQSEPIRQLIEDIDASSVFDVIEVTSLQEGRSLLDDRDVRAVVDLVNSQVGLEQIDVIIDTTDPLIKQMLYLELPKIIDSHTKDASLQLLTAEGIPFEKAADIIAPLDINMSSNQSKDLKFFDFYASGLIVLVVLGVPLLQSVTSITIERSRGTIERLFVSPYSRTEIIVGKLLAHSVFAVIVSILTTVSLKLIFDIALGNILLVFLVASLAGINGVVIGLLISCVTYSESQSVVVGTFTYLGLIMMMTFFWPLETMNPVASYFAQALPFTHALSAMRQVNLLDSGIMDIWPELLILCGTALVLTIPSVQLLRREVK